MLCPNRTHPRTPLELTTGHHDGGDVDLLRSHAHVQRRCRVDYHLARRRFREAVARVCACTRYACTLCTCTPVYTPRLLNKRKMAAATARGGASPRVDTADTEGFGPVTVLLPCYLPNEQVRLYFYTHHERLAFVQTLYSPNPYPIALTLAPTLAPTLTLGHPARDCGAHPGEDRVPGDVSHIQSSDPR